MTTTTPESRGHIAYSAYGRKVSFINYRGEPMPTWDELTQEIRDAWIFQAGIIWDLATTGRASI